MPPSAVVVLFALPADAADAVEPLPWAAAAAVDEDFGARDDDEDGDVVMADREGEEEGVEEGADTVTAVTALEGCGVGAVARFVGARC